MFNIFSSREIASAVYIIIFIVLMMFSKKIRQGIMKVIEAALTPKLVIPFVLLLAYAIGVIFLFCKLSFWKNVYIKDIIIWVMFVGVPVSFNAVSKGEEEHYFRDIFWDNIKLTAIVEFFIGTFTFNIWIELGLQFVVLFCVLMQTGASLNVEYSNVKKLFDWILVVIGGTVLYYTAKAALGTYQNVDVVDTIVSFIIPIIFSVLYIPVAYMFALWAKYEIVFIRMSFKEPEDRKVKWKHRKEVLKVCNVSLKKVYRFNRECISSMYISMKPEEFMKIIDEFDKNNAERHI